MSGSFPASAPQAIPIASAQAGACIQPAALAAPNPTAVKQRATRNVRLTHHAVRSPLPPGDRAGDRARGRLADADVSAVVGQADQDWVEDYLQITNVEPGRIW